MRKRPFLKELEEFEINNKWNIWNNGKQLSFCFIVKVIEYKLYHHYHYPKKSTSSGGR